MTQFSLVLYLQINLTMCRGELPLALGPTTPACKEKEGKSMTTSLLSSPGHAGGLRCKTCSKPIRNSFQNELICFDCWSARKLSEPERHNHHVSLPKPKPGGIEDGSGD
jgi:hypothetical protein